MNTETLKAVAFDLDGTLVDSAPDLASSINLMLKELDRMIYPIELIKSWVGNGVEVLVKRALSGSEQIASNLDETLYQDARARFDRLYAENLCVETRPYPGVIEALQWLSEQRIPMAVITNKPYAFTVQLLEQLNMSHFFEIMLGGDSLDKRKPDPYPLQYALDKLHLRPRQMLMVGDSRNDILAAKAAGCPSLGMTYGYNYGIPITESEPDWSADRLTIIQTLFG
ncbi:phosphoglycolate phosphatase [Celerinatantimonas sp. YJH-8]|uniref:phosphoglycolate phosphatase n=1 Tax=Celerinatantimonas sp. YJH-8 TaxID=3228714 RepID=UPI0038C89BAB